jgi:hypothetical protein
VAGRLLVVSIRKFEGDEQRPSRQLGELLAQQLAIAPEERATSVQFARPRPAARATYERAVAAVRANLGDEAFAAAWAEGLAMTVEQAIAEALGT